jgi:multicomponent Na+:H+ antiporter subunit F
MTTFYLALVLFLLLNLGIGLVRVQRGPTQSDRMVAAMLFGTTGVAILLLLAEVTGQESLIDVALVFSLLATINTIAFVREGWGALGSRGRRR